MPPIPISRMVACPKCGYEYRTSQPLDTPIEPCVACQAFAHRKTLAPGNRVSLQKDVAAMFRGRDGVQL